MEVDIKNTYAENIIKRPEPSVKVYFPIESDERSENGSLHYEVLAWHPTKLAYQVLGWSTLAGSDD